MILTLSCPPSMASTASDSVCAMSMGLSQSCALADDICDRKLETLARRLHQTHLVGRVGANGREVECAPSDVSR